MELVFSRDCDSAGRRALSRGVLSGTHLRLALGVYVERDGFNELPPWEQHRLRALALGASKFLVWVTPIGGTLFLIGWLCLAYGGFKSKSV